MTQTARHTFLEIPHERRIVATKGESSPRKSIRRHDYYRGLRGGKSTWVIPMERQNPGVTSSCCTHALVSVCVTFSQVSVNVWLYAKVFVNDKRHSVTRGNARGDDDRLSLKSGEGASMFYSIVPRTAVRTFPKSQCTLQRIIMKRRRGRNWLKRTLSTNTSNV